MLSARVRKFFKIKCSTNYELKLVLNPGTENPHPHPHFSRISVEISQIVSTVAKLLNFLVAYY